MIKILITIKIYKKNFGLILKKLIKKQNLENYHGDTRSIMSESFLKSNPEWLQ